MFVGLVPGEHRVRATVVDYRRSVVRVNIDREDAGVVQDITVIHR